MKSPKYHRQQNQRVTRQISCCELLDIRLVLPFECLEKFFRRSSMFYYELPILRFFCLFHVLPTTDIPTHEITWNPFTCMHIRERVGVCSKSKIV